MVSHNIQS